MKFGNLRKSSTPIFFNKSANSNLTKVLDRNFLNETCINMIVPFSYCHRLPSEKTVVPS